MIKITKSNSVPARLRNQGQAATNDLKDLYDNDPDGFNTGALKFDFSSDIYGHTTVKNLLIKDQFKKCCFCESKFKATGYGDVEHFRPKAGFKQSNKSKLERPGYYWLAYNWENLFFSCQICNQKYKKNFFPLENPDQRAINHNDNINRERPLLIHPSKDDPGNHIGFRAEVCYYKDEKGSRSISIYKLNRKDLLEDRREYLLLFEQANNFARLSEIQDHLKVQVAAGLNMTIEKFNVEATKAIKVVRKSKKKSARFYAMIIDFIEN